MSAPTRADISALRQVSRCLLSAPRLVCNFPWQSDANLDVFVDTDFAGCLPTRWKTLGSAAKRGLHLIKQWSSTQEAVTLSSAEAEAPCGIVKGKTEAFGIQSVVRKIGRMKKRACVLRSCRRDLQVGIRRGSKKVCGEETIDCSKFKKPDASHSSLFTNTCERERRVDPFWERNG